MMKTFKLSLMLSCAVALWAGAPLHAETVVTGVMGSVVAGDRKLDQPSGVPDNELIETGADGSASVFSEDLLVELCSRSSLALNETEENQIIRVVSGDVRLLVDPRASRSAPMQVHTPLAIATVLGTEVYVSVDPVTGATTITSADHPVRVDGLDGSTVTLQGGEQTTIMPGQPLSAPNRLDSGAMDALGSCLTDFHSSIRTMSLDVIRMARMAQTFETVSLAEALPEVGGEASSASARSGPPGPAAELASPAEDIEPVFNQVEIFDFDPGPLPPCGSGIPCDHGTF